MKWSMKLPTEPGTYLFHDYENLKWRHIITVRKEKDKLYGSITGRRAKILYLYVGSWFGPISEES